MVVVAALAVIAAATMIRAGLGLRLLLRSQARDRSFAQSSNEYTGRLQATEDEDEAHELLRRQLERTHPGSHAVVLSRNNSADRLQPRTTLAELERAHRSARPRPAARLPGGPLRHRALPGRSATAPDQLRGVRAAARALQLRATARRRRGDRLRARQSAGRD